MRIKEYSRKIGWEILLTLKIIYLSMSRPSALMRPQVKIHFVSYGDANFVQSRKRIAEEAQSTGLFDSIQIYTEIDRNRWFQRATASAKQVVTQRKGGGYWLWKPLSLFERLSEIGNGEILVYADAGCTISSKMPSMKQLIFLINQTIDHKSGIMCFQNPNSERKWTKRDVFEKIYPEAFNQVNEKQYTANRLIVIKRENTLDHIKEWCDHALNYSNLFDDSPSVLPNAPEFRENRHDQSVFSLISKRRGCLKMKFRDIDPAISASRIRF